MDYKSIADFADEILKRKDPYNHHGSKVADLCLKMAALMDVKFSEHDLKILRFGARLHDIGKIFIEDGILNAHGRLTGNQISVIKTHVTQGFHLGLTTGFDIAICSIIRSHHENMDGSGYPDGLMREDIPFFARMIRVADTYDAMISERAYRKAASAEEALMVIEGEAERCFDPQMVQLLKRVLSEKNHDTA